MTAKTKKVKANSSSLREVDSIFSCSKCRHYRTQTFRDRSQLLLKLNELKIKGYDERKIREAIERFDRKKSLTIFFCDVTKQIFFTEKRKRICLNFEI